jgi:hypothetical protein
MSSQSIHFLFFYSLPICCYGSCPSPISFDSLYMPAIRPVLLIGNNVSNAAYFILVQRKYYYIVYAISVSNALYAFLSCLCVHTA